MIVQVTILICGMRCIFNYHITPIVQEDKMKHLHRLVSIRISNLPIPIQHVVRPIDADHLADAVVDVVGANPKQATWGCNKPPRKC